MKRILKLLLKLALTAFALWFVFSKIDIEQLHESLKSASWGWLAAAFLLFNASKIASALRLELYFRAIGLRLDPFYNLILYYVGMFYNLFLPGGIGGDGYKIYLLNRRYKKPLKPLFQAILLDRLSGLAALGVLALLLLGFSAYVALLGQWSRWTAWIAALAVWPIAWWATKRFFSDFLPVFTPTMVWGLGVQLLQLLCAWAILAALGVDERIVDYLTLFLVSSVAAVLPITVGGVGIRELTFLYGLPLIHRAPEEGVTFSLLFFAVTALSSLTGLFWINRVTTRDEKLYQSRK